MVKNVRQLVCFLLGTILYLALGIQLSAAQIFVISFKDQLIGIILEVLRDLFPDYGENFFAFLGIVTADNELVEVVNVYYGIQSRLLAAYSGFNV